MNCSECLELIDALVDNELTPDETVLMSEHINHCVNCAEAVAELRVLSTKIRKLKPFRPEPELAGNIMAAIDGLEGGTAQDSSSLTKKYLPVVVGAALGSALTAAAMMVAFYLFLTPPLTQKYETREIVSAHIRSLMGNEMVELASSKQHILKPWFGGKLNFAPTVTSLTREGYPLLGARTDYLFDGRVGVVVYTRRAHKINLFIMPNKTGAQTVERSFQASGYNVEEFVRDQFRYIAISDLNSAELSKFATLIENTQ